MDSSYIDVYESNNEIICWSRTTENELKKDIYPLQDYLYCFMPDNSGDSPHFFDIYKNPLKKVSFKNKWDLREYSTSREGLCESDVRPIYKFIIDEYRHAPLDAPFTCLLFDIETNVDLDKGKGYSSIHDPFEPVISIQCFDMSKQKYVLFIPNDYEKEITIKDNDYPVEIHWCDSEEQILKSFSNYIHHIDILAGWHSSVYDIPYIMERAIILFGDDTAKTFLCRDGYKARKRVYINEYGEECFNWTLVGRVSLDMKDLYKKFFPGEKKSFSLDNVCEADLGITKVEYDNDLGTLLRENPQKFFEYGIQDVRLLKMLDDKHGIMALAVMLARKCCSCFYDVTGSVKPIENAIAAFCRDKGNIILPDAKNNEREQFEGAIVYDTISGRHGWSFTIDLASLYPSTMIMLGLSPETMLIQCKQGMKDFIEVCSRNKNYAVTCLITSTNEVFEIVASDLYDLIKESGYTISANGTIFDGSLGLLSEFVQNGVNDRARYKKLAKESYNKKDFTTHVKMDRIQQVIKILNNSVYGVTGEIRFKLYDLRLSKSITLTGQMISKYQAYKGNEIIKELCHG